MILAIVGGGASGMMAALAASRNPSCEVHIFERQNRVGRKLLATGNGRCNLSNCYAAPGRYYGADPDFVIPAFDHLDFQKTMAFFESLGLSAVQEASGRVYPWSDQAGSVVDVLRFALEKENIILHTGWEVAKVKRSEGGFRLESREGSFFCHRLVVACGGLAGTALGGSMSGYQILRSLGHKCSRLRPALVQLKSGYPRCASLKGVRAVCGVELRLNGRSLLQNQGEVQFTQYGLSGPAIFEISRHACAEPGTWECALDVLPGKTQEEIFQHLLTRQKNCPNLEAAELLTGTVHNRLGRVLVQEAELPLNAPMQTVSPQELKKLAQLCKNYVFSLTEPMGMDSAQVTAGGILTGDFDPNRLESRLCPGLFACGEVLDIDGDCGGFNLQWAWSSGHLAGSCAGEAAL